MPDPLDLTGDIAAAVDGAALRGNTLALGYVDDDGYPVVTFRGSTQVHSPDQLALWVRKTSDGFATSIAERPVVSLVYFGPEGPGPKYLSFRGRARIDASVSDVVYENMIDGEREQDPDRNGVAVIIDVDSVRGFAGEGPFEQVRDA